MHMSALAMARPLPPGRELRSHLRCPLLCDAQHAETKYWRVREDKVPGIIEEIEDISHGGASDQDVEKLLAKLRVFREREFADLLHQ